MVLLSLLRKDRYFTISLSIDQIFTSFLPKDQIFLISLHKDQYFTSSLSSDHIHAKFNPYARIRTQYYKIYWSTLYKRANMISFMKSLKTWNLCFDWFSFLSWEFFIFIRNWVFATNSGSISASLCRRPLIFQTMNSVRTNNVSLKYLKFTLLGCKDNGIGKFEFVAKTQFLCPDLLE